MDPESSSKYQSIGDSPWDELTEPKGGQESLEPTSEVQDTKSSKDTTVRGEEILIDIDTGQFRSDMADFLASLYLDMKSEKTVDTTEIDRDIAKKEENDEKVGKEKIKRAIAREEGKIQNSLDNNLNRDNMFARAKSAIIGERETDDVELQKLKDRLDSLTEEYVRKARERYINAITEDSDSFRRSGKYEGVLAAEGELSFEQKKTKKVNKLLERILERGEKYTQEDGTIDEEKIRRTVNRRMFGYDPGLIDQVSSKAIELVKRAKHEESFDRARDGMRIYSANLVGGVARDINKTKTAVELYRSLGGTIVPSEIIAGVAATALSYMTLNAHANSLSGAIATAAVGVGAVAVTSGAKAARRVREDAEVMSNTIGSGMAYIGETPGGEEIMRNGENPDSLNGLTVLNEPKVGETKTVAERNAESNDSVLAKRSYEQNLAEVGMRGNAKTALELAESIEAAFYDDDYETASKAVAEAEERLSLMYDSGHNLIVFSSIQNRASEEKALRDIVFKAKKRLEQGGEDSIKQYERDQDAVREALLDMTETTDKKQKRKEILEAIKQGGKAAVIAGLCYFGTQELIATCSDDVIGFFESMFGKNPEATRQTLLSRLAFGQHVSQISSYVPQKETHTGLNAAQAQKYQQQGYTITQTGNKTYTASSYVVNGQPAQVIIGDNGTMPAEGLELQMGYRDGRITMPVDGSATSSTDLGRNIHQINEPNVNYGLFKIHPDGTSDFIPSNTTIEGSERVFEHQIDQSEFQHFRIGVGYEDKNGVFHIFASDGHGAISKQQFTRSEKIYSATIEKMTKIIDEAMATLYGAGAFFASPGPRGFGKAIQSERKPYSMPDLLPEHPPRAKPNIEDDDSDGRFHIFHIGGVPGKDKENENPDSDLYPPVSPEWEGYDNGDIDDFGMPYDDSSAGYVGDANARGTLPEIDND